MSNNLDLDKEGVVEETCSPEVESDSDCNDESQDAAPVLQSNVTNPTDDGNEADCDSNDEDDEHGVTKPPGATSSANQINEPPPNHTEEAKRNANHENNEMEPRIQLQPPRDRRLWLWVLISSVIIVLIAIMMGDAPLPPPEVSIGTCSKIPDTSVKHKLQCPKCDVFDANGQCIIYVPMAKQQFTLKGKGNDGTLNNYPCVEFQWENEDEYVLSVGEDSEDLEMTFVSPGRERIELTIYINITEQHKTYYKEATCDIELVIYEAPYFGIDLGTTYSCIAYQRPYTNPNTTKRDTDIVIMDESRMEYCIPSTVYFGANRMMSIGNAAKAMAASHNDFANLIYDIKRIIGRASDDPAWRMFDRTHPFQLNLEETYPTIVIPNWRTTVTPEQLLAALLKELVQTASRQYGVPGIQDVVVSIPAIFHDAQRKSVHTACQIAGLDAKLLLVEPSAASIAHTYYAPMDQLKEFAKYFMTLDVGGGTTDVSVLRCTGIHCEVLGVAGNSSLGGIDFDKVVVDIMVDKMLSMKKKLSRATLEQMTLFHEIVAKAETVKKALSTEDQYVVRLKNEKEHSYQQIIVTQKEFEEHPETVRLIHSIIDLTQQAMYDDNPLSSKKGKEHLTNIKAILLIGGTVKIPLVQRMLAEAFVDTRLIYPDDDPQLMVVKGTAIIGGNMAYTDLSNADILQSQIPTIAVDDVLPMSFGFDVCIIDYDEEDGHKCGVMDIMIQKNSKYPTKGSGIYCQKMPTASTATLMLYEGDDVEVENNFFLTKLDISDVPLRSEYECNNIMVELSIDGNGIANITAKTNNQIFSKELPVQSNDGHLSEEQIKVFKAQVNTWFV